MPDITGEYDLVDESDAAILVSDGTTEGWLPKSLITYERHDFPSVLATVTAPEWLLLEKGLI